MKRKLLFSVTKKDLKIEYFSGRGAGGQYRNKHQNCVRIHHSDSGAMSTGQSHRNRQANLKEAFSGLVMHPKFRLWHAAMVQFHNTGKTIDEIVDDAMQPQNIKIECRGNGMWQECPQPS